MHVDRTQTHVISCIYHIASSDDAEPWPIVIEGYDGTTNSVVLKPGDIMLYESAKVRHNDLELESLTLLIQLILTI
jgi:hypothetical protein